MEKYKIVTVDECSTYTSHGLEYPYLDPLQLLEKSLEICREALGFPTIVCLCGSTRFKDEFVKMNLKETLAGRIVVTIGCDMRTDDDIFGGMGQVEWDCTKAKLDELHLRKIELADEVFIINVDGYIGESTKRELEHAKKLNKKIRYFIPPPEPEVDEQKQRSAIINLSNKLHRAAKNVAEKLVQKDTESINEWAERLANDLSKLTD